MEHVEDGDETERPRSSRRRWWWVAGVLVAVLVVASIPLVRSLSALRTVPLDQEGARQRLGDYTPLSDGESPEVLVGPSADPTAGPSAGPTSGSSARATATERPSPADHGYRSFLLIGSDARAGLSGSRADVILVGLLPADDGEPVLFSLPRDLWLDDPCGGGQQRINAAYNGCAGVANGFELTSIVVEDFTGIDIDHVAAIDFEGFKEVIDAVGGVRICVDHPVRDGAALSLPAGCTMAGGDQALAWVRSRKTEELVDGEWRTMPGVSDLTRNQRQQSLMIQLLGRVGSFGTVANLYSFADGVSDSVSLGAGLSLLDGARLAWSMRGRTGDIERFSIPVTGTTTSAGAQVLLPTESFATTFEREIGTSLHAADDGG